MPQLLRSTEKGKIQVHLHIASWCVRTSLDFMDEESDTNGEPEYTPEDSLEDECYSTNTSTVGILGQMIG